MERQDYPLLHQESSACTTHNQKRHFLLVEIQIALLIIVASISSYPLSQQPSMRNGIIALLAILLVVELFLKIWMMLRKYDHVWFSCRAIAESVKTESWRFMMKTEPYDNNVSDSDAENSFITRLEEIFHRTSDIATRLTSNVQGGSQISEHMKQIRNTSLEERKNYYTNNRIHEQFVWYSTKANWNQKRESIWLFISWVLQIAAIIIAIVIVAFTDFNIMPIGIITTAGAGAMSWMHSKSYRELSQSYSLTAHDLSLLESRASQVTTERDLPELVLDVERTISREHSMWLARRLGLHDT